MVLLALDATHLAGGVHAGPGPEDTDAAFAQICGRLTQCWRLARVAFRCPVIQQTALPVHLLLLVGNEHQLAGSRAYFVFRFKAALRPMADAEDVDLLAVDDRAALDAGLWHRSKHEVTLPAAPT